MKKFVYVLLVLSVFLLSGCMGAAGNYNPNIDPASIDKFWKANSDEVAYLYTLFSTKNEFTEAEVLELNQARYTMLSVFKRIEKLQLSGGVTYQDLKINFQLAADQYYLMKPILSKQMNKYANIEPKIIFDNMTQRAEFFIGECNRILKDSENDIEYRGMQDLQKYGEGFYNALSPILNSVI